MIGKWIKENYNKLYVHSELGHLSPEEFEAKYEREDKEGSMTSTLFA